MGRHACCVVAEASLSHASWPRVRRRP